jgi:hypothetical protein
MLLDLPDVLVLARGTAMQAGAPGHQHGYVALRLGQGGFVRHLDESELDVVDVQRLA